MTNQAFLATLTPRQRLDLKVSPILAAIAMFAVYFVAKRNFPAFTSSLAGTCYLAAVMGAVASLMALVSWLIVRPEPPGWTTRHEMFLPDPPVWFMVLRPLAMCAAVALSPLNAWAIVSLVIVWALLFAWRMRLTSLEGDAVEMMDDLERVARRGAYVCPGCKADLPISPPGPRDGKCAACGAAYTRAGLFKAWGLPMPPDDRVI